MAKESIADGSMSVIGIFQQLTIAGSLFIFNVLTSSFDSCALETECLALVDTVLIVAEAFGYAISGVGSGFSMWLGGLVSPSSTSAIFKSERDCSRRHTRFTHFRGSVF
jgi:hypothetical protein